MQLTPIADVRAAYERAMQLLPDHALAVASAAQALCIPPRGGRGGPGGRSSMTPESLAEIFELLAIDHEPDGWPAVQQRYLSAAAAELRRLAAENDALFETFAKVCARLGVDTEAARKLPGKPSDVLIGAIDAAIDAARATGEQQRARPTRSRSVCARSSSRTWPPTMTTACRTAHGSSAWSKRPMPS